MYDMYAVNPSVLEPCFIVEWSIILLQTRWDQGRSLGHLGDPRIDSLSYGRVFTISIRVLGVVPGSAGKFGPSEKTALNSRTSDICFSCTIFQLIL